MNTFNLYCCEFILTGRSINTSNIEDSGMLKIVFKFYKLINVSSKYSKSLIFFKEKLIYTFSKNNLFNEKVIFCLKKINIVVVFTNSKLV